MLTLLWTPGEGHGKQEGKAGRSAATVGGIARWTIVVVAAHRRAIYQFIARMHARPTVKKPETSKVDDSDYY